MRRIALFINIICIILSILLLSACVISKQHDIIEAYAIKDFSEYNIQSLAILPFKVPEYACTDFGYKAAQIFSHNIIESKKFTILDPSMVIEKIGASHQGPLNRIIKDLSITDLGEELEADALLLGTIEKYVFTNFDYSEITITIKVVYTKTGINVWTATETAMGKSDPESEKEKISLLKLVGNVSRTVIDKPGPGSSNLKDSPPSLLLLLDQLSKKMIKQFITDKEG